MPAMATYKTNDAWKPLASLLKKLPALMDLRYGFPGQFPPCLLEALHKYLPRCRLHINTFKLRSLNAPSTDPYELMLATSPSLTSIRVECDMQHGYITKHIPNFNYEAVQSMVGGLAPNLKELQIFHADWEANLDSYLRSKAWRGLTSSDQIESSRPVSGSLRCLEIDVGHAMIEPQLIETWKAHTDFSIVETLKLESYISQDTFACLAANSSLPSLKRLVLRLAGRYIDRRQTNEFFDIARSFLCQLPPLESLELTGELFSLDMNSIPGHHGAASWRRLWKLDSSLLLGIKNHLGYL